MREFTYTIQDADGIHARPAGLLVKEAGKYQSSITLCCGEKTGDAKRIFSVMALGVKCGQTLRVTAEGADEETAAVSLEQFFKENL
ncbi:MAG: HPr family phosphocarrier protein [Clostridia bacterium]|nr:HPr family phosphocarrier protein [Clostridia bacterium]